MSEPVDTTAWPHLMLPGAAEGPVLVALHGTGGDEGDMAAFVRGMAPAAPVLAPRGRVREGRMARYFAREPDDPFRFPDLAERTDELAAFLRAALHAHGLVGRPLHAVGFSNGANAATSLMLRHPGLLARAVLLRGLLPAPPPAGLDLAGTPVLVAAGRADALVPPAMVEDLVRALRAVGAGVVEHWSPGGHGLGPDDVEAARTFLAAA